MACGDDKPAPRKPSEGEAGAPVVVAGGAGGAPEIAVAGEGGNGEQGVVAGGSSGEEAGGSSGEEAGGSSQDTGGAGPVAGAADGGSTAQGNIDEAPVDSSTVVVIELDQRPYAACEFYTIDRDYARNAEGIPIKLYRGTYYNHPVLAAQAGLEWLACYRETNDPWYYNHAIAAGHHLIDTSHDFDGAMFFPYDFDFRLHSNSANVAVAPWYSGMAQGQALSLFSRLGELTSEPEWEEAASATFKSFDYVRGNVDPWIIDLDEDNSLWIEEYPMPGESHVLNGFMFAMFGLYDYFAWRGEEHAQTRFLQSLHTLRINVERFREPGERSVYCLAHRVQATNYHAIHIDQLQAITRMTGDSYFASVADLFAADYQP